MKKNIGILSTVLFCVGVISFFYQKRYGILKTFFFENEYLPGHLRPMVYVEILPCTIVFIALFFFGKFKIANVILKFSVIALMCAGLYSNYLFCINFGVPIKNIISGIQHEFIEFYILSLFLFICSAITAVIGKTRKTLFLF